MGHDQDRLYTLLAFSKESVSMSGYGKYCTCIVYSMQASNLLPSASDSLHFKCLNCG